MTTLPAVQSAQEKQDAFDLARRDYIGGSDAAAILGVSKWTTPIQLYEKKLGISPPDPLDADREKRFKRGKRLEPIAIDMLVDEYGVFVTKRSSDEKPNRYRDPEHDFLRAEVDFEFRVTEDLLELVPPGFIDPTLLGTIQNGEIKTVHPMAAHLWGEEFTDDVPIEYSAQSMHGLMVTGRKLCLYGTLVGAENLLLYRVERDDEIIAGMRAKELFFWFENLGKKIVPDPINMEDMLRLFAKKNGRPVQFDDETMRLLGNLTRIRDSKKAFAGDEEDIQFRIADYVRRQWALKDGEDPVDNAIFLYGDKEVGSWKKQSRTMVDGKRLQAEKPEIAKDFMQTSHFRVMRAKGNK